MRKRIIDIAAITIVGLFIGVVGYTATGIFDVLRLRGSTLPSTGTTGDIRFDNTTSSVKFWNGSQWSEMGGGGGSSGINIMAENNFNAEDAVVSPWTESGDGTLYIEDTTSNVANGSYSFAFDASSPGDYATSGPLAIPSGLYSQNCLLQFYAKGFDENITFQVYDGMNVVASHGLESALSSFSVVQINFICPASGNLEMRIYASDDAAIGYFDEIHLGSALNLGLYNPPTEYSAKISADDVISDETPSGWLEACPSTSNGVYPCTFDGAFANLTSVPNCSVTVNDDDDLGRIYFSSLTTSGATITIKNSGGTAINRDFILKCTKTGADVPQPVMSLNTMPTITNPQSYTPNFQGFGTVTNIAITWQRIGPNIFIYGTATLGTTTSDEAQMSLPIVNGEQLTVSDETSATVVVGNFGLNNTAALSRYILATGGNSYLQFGIQSSSFSSNVPRAGSAFTNSSNVTFHALVPIEGWEAPSVIMPNVAHAVTTGSRSVTKMCSATCVQSSTHTCTDFDDCIATIDDDGAGKTGLNFKSGYYSGNVRCSVTRIGTSFRVCSTSADPTKDSVEIVCETADGNDADGTFNVTCWGTP